MRGGRGPVGHHAPLFSLGSIVPVLVIAVGGWRLVTALYPEDAATTSAAVSPTLRSEFTNNQQRATNHYSSLSFLQLKVRDMHVEVVIDTDSGLTFGGEVVHLGLREGFHDLAIGEEVH